MSKEQIPDWKRVQGLLNLIDETTESLAKQYSELMSELVGDGWVRIWRKRSRDGDLNPKIASSCGPVQAHIYTLKLFEKTHNLIREVLGIPRTGGK
jgi:hypothetical protein